MSTLYTIIEDVAAWPEGTNRTQAVFPEKSVVPEEVMSHMMLFRMAVLHRKWASLRLSTLEGWIEKSALPEIYAGAGSQGAEDARYQSMVDLELLQLEGNSYCGGVPDIRSSC